MNNNSCASGKANNRKYRTCGDANVVAGRGPGQLGWYEFAKNFIGNLTVLDVGCGLGDGIRIMSASGAKVTGQDLDPRLETDLVRIAPVSDFGSKSVDIVTNIDVVEHVEDDITFVRDLARIAKRSIFITTPNWTAGRCQWPYHVREYTPRQFYELLEPLGRVTLFKGRSNGYLVHPVRYRNCYNYLNDFRIRPSTAFITRCCNRLLPSSYKIHSHNAALVELKS
jgi:hypothetical protein